MEGKKVPVYLGKVTYIVDLDYFYMQIGTAEQIQEFSLIEEKLTANSTCYNSTHICDLTDNDIVLVDCLDTYGCWRRGQVMRIDSDNNTADVFYIDFGETENIGEDRICTDIAADVAMYPSQALRCSLAGIKPIAKKWTTRATKMFEQQTQLRIFNTIILKSVNGTFRVALYTMDGQQRCLSSILVDEELGFSLKDEVTEFFGDAEEFYSEKLQDISADTYYSEWESGEKIYSNQSEGICEDEFNQGDVDNSVEIAEVDQQFVSIETEVRDNSPYYESNMRNKSFSPARSPFQTKGDQNLNASPLGVLLEKISQSGDKSSPTVISQPLFSAGDNTRSPRNTNNSNQLSPQMIPQFNLDFLHKTKIATSEKLLEKVQKETQATIKIEQDRVRKETKEQSELAVLAGYGGIEDDSPEKPENKWMNSGGKEDWDLELSSGKSGPALKDISPPPPDARESAHGRELLKVLNQIFIESEREPVEEIRVRLISLFQTDSYLYLNKEEMIDVLNTVLNRAVRYYGRIHDVILEIIDILSGTKHFQECLLDATKRIQDMYIKIQYKGKPFHVPCSKIIGYLFNMSFHWMNSTSLREYVKDLLEKWIMFNKKGKQIGIDTLQELYLESFETVWEICGESLVDLKPTLLVECKDKILNKQVSQTVREKALEIYLLINLTSPMTTRKTCSVQASVETVEKASQTERYSGDPEDNTNLPGKNKNSKPPFYPPKSSSYYKERSRSSTPSSVKSEESWPSLPKANVVPVGKAGYQNELTEPVYLLSPASFAGSSREIVSDSSPENSRASSKYHSLTSNDNRTSNEIDSEDNKREVSPFARLIQKDLTTNFYQKDTAQNEFIGVKDWGNVEDKPKVKQDKVKDSWYDSDTSKPTVIQDRVKDNWYDSDTSESMKSDRPFRQYSETTGHNDRLNSEGEKPQKQNTDQHQPKEVDKKTQEQNISNEPENAGKYNDDTDENIDDFDDEDWESYTESADEISNDSNQKFSDGDKQLTDKSGDKPMPSWRPGVRKCTVCGDTSHLIYECPNKHKRGLFY